ncbi:PD-(D/E)XK nuclease-like domain-containing protein [Kosakonia sp. S58]|uniref:RecE family exodeoxyribonuclease n=1 Tax=unclassified Kosakonia TaxID=2632876 RepID=UPI00190823FB|nr:MULTISPECIES: RecE family exodeoxyribonuclease [unclassified Kosakonia]MBK0078662.1 PD-(D/E)XK nuclease-like domain-containing protein [Kosakonia sp. S57]MBK0085371.1 PD-(D/E)XK nuclease-like domain-containing protein [Kosakonia sp. S58]
MEFFYVVKATQKSAKQDAVIWFTAKSEARAALTLDVELEEAGIETGRGKDYAKPIRTDFPIVNDLPEEGVVDFTWCDRYQLADDQRTWNVIPGAAAHDETDLAQASTINDADLPAALVTATDTADAGNTSPLENRTPSVRLAVHLLGDKYHSEISQEQQIVANELAMDEANVYFQNLLQAKNEVPDMSELSLHAEWKLVQAVKDVFSQDKEHEPALLAAFMSSWVKAEVGERAQLVEDWLGGKLPATELADASEPGEDALASSEIVRQEATPEEVAQAQSQVQAFRDRDITELHAVPTLSFRHRLLAQFITEKEYAYHIDNEQLNTVRQLEMDTDNSYVQNLLLAAENVEGMKNLRDFEFWRLTDAVKRVFPSDKATPDLSLMLQFMKAWKTTDYIDRGLLAKEWINGNRVSTIQRTDTGTNAGGGIKTDRNADYEHTLDTLDIEIACATLPMDFDIYNIPGSIHRRAKDIVAARESPWKEWSTALRKTAGILDYSRAAIFALIREASSGITTFPDRMTGYISATLNEYKHDTPEARILAAARQIDSAAVDAGVIQCTELSHQLVATPQPEVSNLGGGMFSIDGLLDEKANPVIITPSNEVAKQEVEIVGSVQMEETDPSKVEAGNALPAVEVANEVAAQTISVSPADILAAATPELTSNVAADLDQNIDALSQDEPELPPTEPETTEIGPVADISEPEAAAKEWPAYFEPGRYEGLPNDVYHAANGISSTQVKDARVSLMYFEARHVSKTIQKERSKVLDMGNLVHALALQPEMLAAEFSIEPEIPEGALTTTATIRECIDEYNDSLPSQLSADDIKALLEAHNATLPMPLPLGVAVDETAESYMALPEEFQRIEADKKQTAAAMKACIKEYNATLPAPVKTSGSRDALLEQLAIINPDLVAQEAQKPQPLKVSGTKADLIQAVKAVKPDAVFADELLDAWRENPEGKVLVTRQQLETALAIQKALHAHPTAGKLLQHPDRAVETSYFGIDEETGLEIRVRPDLELDVDGVRIGADLKTISMWNIKQSGLRAKLHREIIDRDYHLSAGMYMETASLDQFFWIFVNKDEGYHWIAIVEASQELVELGILEYRATMRAIANAFDTGEWPAPITTDYTDELTEYDLRRLEALRAA